MGWKGSWYWAPPSRQLPSPSATSPLSLSSISPQCQQHVLGFVYCGLRNRLAWKIIHWVFLAGLPWLVCPAGPSGCCTSSCAGSGGREAWSGGGQASVGHSCGHTHACTFGSPAGTSGKEKGILHSGLGRAVLCWKDGDGHVGDASMPSLLLAVHELLWALWSPSWNYILFSTEEQ